MNENYSNTEKEYETIALLALAEDDFPLGKRDRDRYAKTATEIERVVSCRTSNYGVSLVCEGGDEE